MTPVNTLWAKHWNTNEIAKQLGMTEPEVDRLVMRYIRQRARRREIEKRLEELRP